MISTTAQFYGISRMSITCSPDSKAAGFIPAEDSSPPINGGLVCVMRICPNVNCYRTTSLAKIELEKEKIRGV
jgi:hypothetical protein